jgi:hypothetical protein
MSLSKKDQVALYELLLPNVAVCKLWHAGKKLGPLFAFRLTAKLEAVDIVTSSASLINSLKTSHRRLRSKWVGQIGRWAAVVIQPDIWPDTEIQVFNGS